MLFEAAPGTPRSSNSTLADELESSSRLALLLLSQDNVSGTDHEEIGTGVDQCIHKFLDIARQTMFFPTKRIAVVQKPEQVI